MARRLKEPEPTTLAEAIKAARLAKGWTQWELARRLGTREKNVYNWEAGKNAPSLPMYARMCSLFGWELPYEPSPSEPSTPDKRTRPGRPTLDPTRELVAVGG